VNVTPNTPPQLPILYTWNNGQVYELAGLQGFGCVDTVYSTTATTVNGTTTYSTYSVLPANQGLQIVEAYQAQFGVANLACNDYVQQAMMYNQAGATSTVSSSSTFLGMSTTTAGGIIEIGIFFFAVVIILVGIVKGLEMLFGGKRR
jgi:hypothetical protein